MKRLTDTNLKKALESSVARLYLVAGNDAFLVDGCVGAIARAALGESRDELLRFSQKELQNGAFEELFYSFSILGQLRVAIVEDFGAAQLKAADRKLLEALLPEVPDDLVVVLRYYTADKRFSVPKALLDIASASRDSTLVTVTAKTGAELLRYIGHIAKREGCDIEAAAEKKLAALCGDDLLLISNEIRKMAALSDYTTITQEHVAALGVRTAEAGVYQMLSAIEAGNTQQAAALLRDMLGDQFEPLAVAAVLNTAFINLYRARLTRDAGHSMQYMVEHFDYRKGDRKVAIAYERCLKYSGNKLERIIGILYRLDRALKSSAVDARYILEQRVVEISSVVAA